MMYVSCCTMITIVVLTVVHLYIVIHWVWLWIECMSSMFDTGIWYMIRWSNKTCVVVNTCSSCIIPLLLTWWERIDMLDECCILSWIVYMFMIWYEFCCYMYFFQYFYHFLALEFHVHRLYMLHASFQCSLMLFTWVFIHLWKYDVIIYLYILLIHVCMIYGNVGLVSVNSWNIYRLLYRSLL